MNRQNQPIFSPTFWLGLFVFVALWLVYFFSASPGGDPTSAFEIFSPSLHVGWRIPRKAPIWFGLALVTGKISVAAVLPVLHWVSITSAALTGALVATFTAGVRPPGSDSSRYSSASIREQILSARKPVPMLIGGAVAGLAFGLYPPYWLEAIRATPTALHMLILLTCMHLIRSAMRRESKAKLYLFCLLYGFGMSSYPTMLVLFPAFGVLVILLSSQWEETRGAELLKCVFFGAIGTTGFLIIPLYLWLSPYRDVHQLESFAEAMRYGLQGQWLVIKIAIFSFMGILPAVFCLLPYAIFIVLPRHSSDAWGKIGGLLLRVIFTFIGAFFLLGWPVDLQAVYGVSYVAIFPIMIASIWFGFLMAEWIMATIRKWDSGDRTSAFAYSPMLAGVLLPLIMLVIFFSWTDRSSSRAAKFMARTIQENIPDETEFLWVDASPSWNGTYLQYELLAAGKDTFVINISHLSTPFYQDFLRNRFPDVDWPKTSITIPDDWLSVLLERDPSHQSIAILADPEAILTSGLEFIAEPSFYLAQEKITPAGILEHWNRAKALFQEYRQFLEPVTESMVKGTLENPTSRLPEGRYPYLRARYAGTQIGLPALRHVSRIYNDIGFLLSQTDQNQEAEEAFKLALQIYPDNPSPVGNLAMLKAPSEGSRINPEETSMASSGGADSAAFNALRLQFSNTLERELKRWPGFQRKDLIFLLPGTFGFIADPSLFAHMAGFYLRRMGNSERAIAASKLARNVSKIGKDSFSAILGDLLLYSGAPEEARLEWEKLLETNPDNQQLRLRLAATYLELGDFQKVEEVLADSNAQNAQILRTLAKSLEMQEQGDFLGSLEVLEELAEARPQDPIPQVILAQMAIASEEYPKARSHIAKAKRAGWSPFEADLMDAQIALAKGTPEEKERAVKLVERMLQTSPSDNRVINLKISIAMDEEDWDEARKWAEKMIELDNNSPVGYRALGFISMMEGDRSSATQYYQRAVLLQEDPSTLNNLSNLYYERGDLPLAEVTARKGIKLAPNDPYLLDTLGTILQKAGKSEEALGLFRKACEEAEFLPPATQATLYSHLGLLLAESQDPVRKLEAKTALGKAIELKDYLEESEQQKLEQALKTVNQ